jgi:hypothetical protein
MQSADAKPAYEMPGKISALQRNSYTREIRSRLMASNFHSYDSMEFYRVGMVTATTPVCWYIMTDWPP